MRLVYTLVACSLAATPLAAQSVGPDTPEGVAQRYVTAMRARDWKSMAALMHPLALAKFRTMLGGALRSPDASTLRQQFFGNATPAQVDSLSDADFYARFIAAAMRQSAELQTMMDSAQVKILGHVSEAPDLSHVVFTLRLAMGPVAVSKPDVITLKRQGNTWLALLRADLEIMAAALQQRFGT